MNCKHYEEMMINNQTSPDLLSHLQICKSCIKFKSLTDYQPVTLRHNSDFITKEIDEAMKTASRIKHLKDRLSLTLFIIIAILLTSTIALAFKGSLTHALKYYFIGITTIMPISLPVVSFVRRKAV